MSPAKTTAKPAKSTTTTARKPAAAPAKKSSTTAAKSSQGFSAEEKAAMKARAAEMKAEARAGKDRAAGEKAVKEAIAAMKGADKAMAKRINEIVTSNAPGLMPKTWYGMPSYADKDGNVICFFQAAAKFGARYATFGFNDRAKLDDGGIWAIGFAVKEMTPEVESKITKLVKKAVR